MVGTVHVYRNIAVLTSSHNLCFREILRKRIHTYVNPSFTIIKFPFKRKACQVYRVGYGRGRIW